MDKDLIRAYLWEEIIRLGFSPASTKEQLSWLHQYGGSLKEFWESEYPKHPNREDGKIKASIDSIQSVNLSLEYCVTTSCKFAVRFLYNPPQNNKELMWIHDVDCKYFAFPSQHFLSLYNRRPEAIRSYDETDLKVVLDSLLYHPVAHQHIESPIDNHEIRLGGGTANAFHYLFHLRYQLCPIPEKRMAEELRLLALFDHAIKNNMSISANDLMAQPEM